MNLRESLRGPVEKHNLEGGIWNYEFVKDDLSMPFQSLGFALLADTAANDKQGLSILVSLLKHPSFVPELIDFESFVTVCRGKCKTMMLKAFVQAYSMQFIFSSFPLDAQTRITRLLLGLTSDGENELFAMLESSIILKKPYQLIVLIEAMKNHGNISQMKEIARDLLTHLTKDQITLAFALDTNLSQTVVQVDQELQSLNGEEDVDQVLISNMKKLVSRLKIENEEFD